VVLNGANEFVAIASALKVGTLTVKPVYLESLLLDSQQTSLDIFLNLLHVTLLLLKLTDQIIELLLKDFILCRRVQVV